MLQMHMVRCLIKCSSSALKCYGVSEKWIKIIQQYYGGIWSKCFQEFSPSSWHHHQRGIFIGCTVSIVLFLAAINVIIEFTLSLQDSFIQEHRLGMKAFMDDLFVMSSSIKGTELLLNRCTQVLTWAGMSFRAEKSRCIVIDGGVVLRCYQSSTIRFVDTLPHFLIRVYSWKCGADGCYRQMWQVSCRRQGMLTQGPAPDPKSKV